MTTTTMPAVAATPNEALEKKRRKVYKIFLYATLFNNTLLAINCFAFSGGSMMESAPAWAAPLLGSFGLMTIVSALFALKLKRWGVIGVAACGVAAVVLAVGLKLLLAASLFALGTAFWALIARRNWARLV